MAAVDVPVIGSLNGVTPGGWADYARAMQDAGAAAIELNIYYLPGDTHTSGRDVEQVVRDIDRDRFLEPAEPVGLGSPLTLMSTAPQPGQLRPGLLPVIENGVPIGRLSRMPAARSRMNRSSSNRSA